MVNLEPSFKQSIPPGDDKLRSVCESCGFIDYVNPKIVAGAVVRSGEKFLLCRRAIEPRLGYWTVPAGYMENGESVEEAACREAQEEACANIVIKGLLGVYSVPRISQVHMMFAADLPDGRFDVGPESQEVQLFSWDDIPWDELAFPTVEWALNDYNASIAARDANSVWAPKLRTAGPMGQPSEG